MSGRVYIAIVAATAGAALAGQAAAQARLAAFHDDLAPAEYAAAVQGQTLRDQAECRDQISHDRARGFSVTSTAPSLGGALATGLVAGVVAGAVMGAMENNRDVGTVNGCMARRGYLPLALTPAQTAEMHALHGGERDKWLERTAEFAPKPNSDTFAVMMWDVQMNKPVSVHRDPASGEYLRTWTLTR